MSEESTEISLRELWEELKVTVDSIELDILKQANGNASAGVRARRGLRSLKSDVTTLIRSSIQFEKDKKSK